MKLTFDTTTWQKTKNDHHLMVMFIAGQFGWTIDCIVAKEDEVLLKLHLKTKENIISLLNLIHVAGVMMSKDKNAISDIDRNVFASEIMKLNSGLQQSLRQDEFVDISANRIHLYGRDLWELLGQSNLLHIL